MNKWKKYWDNLQGTCGSVTLEQVKESLFNQVGMFQDAVDEQVKYEVADSIMAQVEDFVVSSKEDPLPYRRI